MLKPRRELDLALEPIRGNAGAELGRQQLYDDAAAEARFFSEKDTRHAAAAQFTLEIVGRAQTGTKLLEEIAQMGNAKRDGEELP